MLFVIWGMKLQEIADLLSELQHYAYQTNNGIPKRIDLRGS